MRAFTLNVLLAVLAVTAAAAPTKPTTEDQVQIGLNQQHEGQVAPTQTLVEVVATAATESQAKQPVVVKVPDAKVPTGVSRHKPSTTKRPTAKGGLFSGLWGKETFAHPMSCFCAGGSVCCHSSEGGQKILNCNYGGCGV